MGVFLTQSVFELDSEHSHVKTFVESFKEKYGEEPDIFAAHGYDAMKLIATVMEGRRPLPSEVPKGFREINDFPGVTGSVQFNDKGDVLKLPRVYIIGQDLLLQDYNERARQQLEEIRKRKEALRRKLEAINKEASEIRN